MRQGLAESGLPKDIHPATEVSGVSSGQHLSSRVAASAQDFRAAGDPGSFPFQSDPSRQGLAESGLPKDMRPATEVPGASSGEHLSSRVAASAQDLRAAGDPGSFPVQSDPSRQGLAESGLPKDMHPATEVPGGSSGEGFSSRVAASAQDLRAAGDPGSFPVQSNPSRQGLAESGLPKDMHPATEVPGGSSGEHLSSRVAASGHLIWEIGNRHINSFRTKAFDQVRPERGDPKAGRAARGILDLLSPDPPEHATTCVTTSAQAPSESSWPQFECSSMETAACEAVLLNTAGGIAGGDWSRFHFTAGFRSHAVLTTQAQEKIYRSEGPPARIELDIALHPQARFEWLPQETILFQEARLHRHVRVEMAGDSHLLLLESQIFGRLASGESHTQGSLRESWRIFRGGKLIFAEELRLEDDMAGQLDRKALGGGARAIATLLLVSPFAEARLEELRAVLRPSAKGLNCAASAWNGLLLARFTAVSPELLRGAMIASLSALRRCALPRVWQV